jgi:hypothetical protein
MLKALSDFLIVVKRESELTGTSLTKVRPNISKDE